jgi:DNA-binding GntR family transcriptional regulator
MRLRAHVAEQHHATMLAAIEANDSKTAREALTADIAGTARYIEQQNWLPASS